MKEFVGLLISLSVQSTQDARVAAAGAKALSSATK